MYNLIPVEFYNRIMYKSISIVTFLEYLEKNHLIYFTSLWDKTSHTVILNSGIHFEYGETTFPLLGDREYEFITEKLFNSIIPTPELIEFVNNNFKDKEQIRHEENVLIQRASLEQANRSTKAATKLGWISTVIAFFSFVAAVASLTPESRRQQWFGIIKRGEPVKQRLKESYPDTVVGGQKQIVNKKSLISDTLKSK